MRTVGEAVTLKLNQIQRLGEAIIPSTTHPGMLQMPRRTTMHGKQSMLELGTGFLAGLYG